MERKFKNLMTFFVIIVLLVVVTVIGVYLYCNTKNGTDVYYTGIINPILNSINIVVLVFICVFTIWSEQDRANQAIQHQEKVNKFEMQKKEIDDFVEKTSLNIKTTDTVAGKIDEFNRAKRYLSDFRSINFKQLGINDDVNIISKRFETLDIYLETMISNVGNPNVGFGKALISYSIVRNEIATLIQNTIMSGVFSNDTKKYVVCS